MRTFSLDEETVKILEEASRRTMVPMSRLLDIAVREWAKRNPPPADQ